MVVAVHGGSTAFRAARARASGEPGHGADLGQSGGSCEHGDDRGAPRAPVDRAARARARDRGALCGAGARARSRATGRRCRGGAPAGARARARRSSRIGRPAPMSRLARSLRAISRGLSPASSASRLAPPRGHARRPPTRAISRPRIGAPFSSALTARVFERELTPSVRAIVEDVRARGDAAVCDASRRVSTASSSRRSAFGVTRTRSPPRERDVADCRAMRFELGWPTSGRSTSGCSRAAPGWTSSRRACSWASGPGRSHRRGCSCPPARGPFRRCSCTWEARPLPQAFRRSWC